MENNGKPKAGRPRVSYPPGTLVSLGLRVPSELKDALGVAADATGRHQSQEASRRLIAAFEWQPMIDIVTAIEMATGAGWKEDRTTHKMVVLAIDSYLSAFAPRKGSKAKFDVDAFKVCMERVIAELTT